MKNQKRQLHVIDEKMIARLVTDSGPFEVTKRVIELNFKFSPIQRGEARITSCSNFLLQGIEVNGCASDLTDLRGVVQLEYRNTLLGFPFGWFCKNPRRCFDAPMEIFFKNSITVTLAFPDAIPMGLDLLGRPRPSRNFTVMLIGQELQRIP